MTFVEWLDGLVALAGKAKVEGIDFYGTDTPWASAGDFREHGVLRDGAAYLAALDPDTVMALVGVAKAAHFFVSLGRGVPDGTKWSEHLVHREHAEDRLIAALRAAEASGR